MANQEQQTNGMSIRPMMMGSLGAIYYFIVRPNLMRWGTQFGEDERDLPGDRLILEPNSTYTHAIDIDAPPRVIWTWLAQMGRDGTGFYNFDSLSNENIPSANYLRRDLPALETGAEWDNGMKVLEIEPEKHLIVGDFSRPHKIGSHYDITLLFYLQELVRDRTRVLARVLRFAPGVPGMLYNFVQEPIDFAQSIAQLKNVKALAEASKHLFVAPREQSNGHVRLKLEN